MPESQAIRPLYHLGDLAVYALEMPQTRQGCVSGNQLIAICNSTHYRRILSLSLCRRVYNIRTIVVGGSNLFQHTSPVVQLERAPNASLERILG